MKKSTLSDIIRNGGATLNGKNLRRISFADGYQVSLRDCFTIDASDADGIIAAVESLRGTAENIGIWIDGGKAYIDISERIADKSDALRIGKQREQLSIYGWKEAACFDC